MQNGIENDHERFRALEREALLPDVASVQERFEGFRFEKGAEQGDLRFARCAVLRRARFEPVPDPVTKTRVLNMLELGANRLGVNAFEHRDHLAQRHLAAIQEEFRRNLQTEVFLAEAQLAQTEERILRAFVRQRIDPSDGVPKRAIGVNQSIDAGLERALRNLLAQRKLSRGRAIPQRQVAQLEPFKKRRPGGIDRLRVFLPAPVVFLEQFEIYVSGKRGAHGGFNLQGSAGAAS